MSRELFKMTFQILPLVEVWHSLLELTQATKDRCCRPYGATKCGASLTALAYIC